MSGTIIYIKFRLDGNVMDLKAGFWSLSKLSFSSQMLNMFLLKEALAITI
jgi:hypothetical protein